MGMGCLQCAYTADHGRVLVLMLRTHHRHRSQRVLERFARVPLLV